MDITRNESSAQNQKCIAGCGLQPPTMRPKSRNKIPKMLHRTKSCKIENLEDKYLTKISILQRENFIWLKYLTIGNTKRYGLDSACLI